MLDGTLAFFVSDYFPLYAGERCVDHFVVLGILRLGATLCIASLLFVVSLSFPSIFNSRYYVNLF